MLSVFLRMTKNITKVIYEKEKMMLETAALFISSCYAPWALMSYMVAKAPSNVLSAIKSAFQIKAQAGSACQHAALFLEFT
jgi:uroporphyrinogen-III decarboxylase